MVCLMPKIIGEGCFSFGGSWKTWLFIAIALIIMIGVKLIYDYYVPDRD